MHDALPLANSSLPFRVIYLFYQFSARRGEISKVAYYKPTLGHFYIIVIILS